MGGGLAKRRFDMQCLSSSNSFMGSRAPFDRKSLKDSFFIGASDPIEAYITHSCKHQTGAMPIILPNTYIQHE